MRQFKGLESVRSPRILAGQSLARIIMLSRGGMVEVSVVHTIGVGGVATQAPASAAVARIAPGRALGRRWDARTGGTFGLFVTTSILLFAALFLPWWVFEATPTGPGQYGSSTAFGLGMACYTFRSLYTCALYPPPTGAPDPTRFSGMVTILQGASLASFLFAVVGAASTFFGVIWPRFARLAFRFGVAGSAATAASVVLFALTVPDSLSPYPNPVVHGFFGSLPGNPFSYTWGAGLGWWSALASAAALTAATVLARGQQRRLAVFGDLVIIEAEAPCRVCGFPVPVGDRFCGACGQPVAGGAA